MHTLVIGAGFAGLSAAYHLQKAGVAVTVIEARDRIGGRVHTDRTVADYPVEVGAELIHGADASTWEWVKALGLETIHWQKTTDSRVRLEDGRWLTMLDARNDSPEFDITRHWHLPDVPVLDGDESWEAYLRRIGFTDEQMQYVRRSFANAVGDDPRYLSAEAMLAELAYEINHPPNPEKIAHDYRIIEGYDSIYTHLAQNLDIRLNHVVQTISYTDDSVTVTLADGSTLTGDNAVITLPIGVLKAGTISFQPELPIVKREAINHLEMCPILKIVFRFDTPLTDTPIAAIYSHHNPPMWWTPAYGRETNQHVWTAFLSGDWAREMHTLGEQGAIDKALASLRLELEQPDLQYISAKWINWIDDPYALGGYSYVQIGHGDARAKLAQPTPPLYWAGEATAPHSDTATVHGAYDSGKRVADEILRGQGK